MLVDELVLFDVSVADEEPAADEDALPFVDASPAVCDDAWFSICASLLLASSGSTAFACVEEFSLSSSSSLMLSSIVDCGEFTYNVLVQSS